MLKYKMLILTDHNNHSSENSLYAFVQAIRIHHRCAQVDVATRANPLNDLFFIKHMSKSLHVVTADESFAFNEDGKSFKKNIHRELIRSYDVIWLRMPPPLYVDFLDYLKSGFPHLLIINAPDGIVETGSKGFLTKFPELCAPMKVCKTVEDILSFKSQFPIVLKPFREYGGKGIVRIDEDKVWIGKDETDLTSFLEKIQEEDFEYLGVKYLKNVTQGDKRIVVVDGHILGASLRLPSDGSWLCNIAMGGQSEKTEADEDEIRIVEKINPVLSDMGIIMYGVDTLMGDDNTRLLSEINTTSIGGLPQIAQQWDKPLVKQAADLIWNYIVKNI